MTITLRCHFGRLEKISKRNANECYSKGIKIITLLSANNQIGIIRNISVT